MLLYCFFCLSISRLPFLLLPFIYLLPPHDDSQQFVASKAPECPSPLGSLTHSESTSPPCHYHFSLFSHSPAICSARMNEQDEIKERESAGVINATISEGISFKSLFESIKTSKMSNFQDKVRKFCGKLVLIQFCYEQMYIYVICFILSFSCKFVFHFNNVCTHEGIRACFRRRRLLPRFFVQLPHNKIIIYASKSSCSAVNHLTFTRR